MYLGPFKMQLALDNTVKTERNLKIKIFNIPKNMWHNSLTEQICLSNQLLLGLMVTFAFPEYTTPTWKDPQESAGWPGSGFRIKMRINPQAIINLVSAFNMRIVFS